MVCGRVTWEGVISLASRRPAVNYTIRIRQGWDGELAVLVEDIARDSRSRKAAADAMRRAADLIETGEIELSGNSG